MSNELKVAIEAAKAGAKAALKYFKTNPSFELKPDNSPVTKADKESENVIRKYISNVFPKANFLGEEGGGSLEQKEVWLIDPLDGTKNFIRGLPFWGIEISLVRDNKIIVGVSFAPSINELLFAERGGGAHCNNKRIFVSKVNRLSDAFLNHGTLSYFGHRLSGFLKLASSTFRQRGFGDLYGYHLVAQGKADIMMDAGNKPWDIAAIKVIVEEAGGKVTNFKGEEWQLVDTTAVATNGLLHDEVIRILNEIHT